MQLSLSWCIHSCSSAGYSQLIRDKWRTGEKTGTPSFCLDSLLFTESIIRTSKWIALQHRHDSKPWNTGGWMQRNSIWREKKHVTPKERERQAEVGRKIEGCLPEGCQVSGYEFLQLSAVLLPWEDSLLLPSASYTDDTGLTGFHLPPLHLLHSCSRTLTSPCGTCLFAARTSTHPPTRTQYLTCVLVIS